MDTLQKEDNNYKSTKSTNLESRLYKGRERWKGARNSLKIEIERERMYHYIEIERERDRM